MRQLTEPIAVGKTIGQRYEVLDELGAGGFGMVFKGQQLNSGKLVAIKVLHSDRLTDAKTAANETARFQREMRLVAGLKHPNIVPLIDSGETADGAQYIVLEFIEGEGLDVLLANDGPFEPREALRLMTEVLDALAAAHAQGVVHRDLKPANIMLLQSGLRRVAMVLDFGVAGVVEDMQAEDYKRLTGAGQVPGTPAYMAPEQIRAEGLDPRSDIYAWGLVFIELLSGEKVFDSPALGKTISMQLSDDPVPLPTALQGHPLGDLLARAVAKDPDARFASAEELLPSLEAITADDALVEALGSASRRKLDRSGDTGRNSLTYNSGDAAGASSGRPRRRSIFTSGISALKTPPERYWPAVAGAVLALAVTAVVLFFALRERPQSAQDSAPTAATAGTEVDAAVLDARTTAHAPDAEQPELGLEAAKQACDDGVQARACERAGDLSLELGADSAKSPHNALAARYFEAACTKDIPAGCMKLGLLFTDGRGVTRNLERAMQLLEQACHEEVYESCAKLGNLYEEGQGKDVESDLATAAELYARACDADDPEGCGRLGMLIYRGRGGTEADPARAVVLLEKACEGGFAHGCSRLGSILQDGKGVPKDPIGALEALERACDLGYARGCSKAGYTLQRGIGVAPNPEKMIVLYEKGCAQGLGASCSSACYVLQVGDGVEADAPKARALCAQSCVLGDAKGCYRHSIQLRDGIGGDQDLGGAREAAEKACKGGEKKACAHR